MQSKYYLAWATDEEIRNKGANGGFVTATLASALETNFIDLALVVQKKSIYEGIPVLTSDPEVVKESGGSLHGVPLNLAKYVLESMPDKRIGLPAKPCDARGIIELAKRKQINLENVYLIGLNCGGTLHPLQLREMASAPDCFGLDPDSVLKEEITGGKLFLVHETGGKEEEQGIRIDELEKQGTLFSSASRKISRTSARLPAMGLSIKTGFLAWMTGMTCLRCGRPSTLSRRTASTFRQSSTIESTISTSYCSRSCLV